MPELATDFQSLPPEYQAVIRLAQETYSITVAPLQLLVGGWSGAVVFLVSVSYNETHRIEHSILKLDRKGKAAKSDEVTRHNAVLTTSSPQFARQHIAELVLERIEQDGAMAIFYRITHEPPSPEGATHMDRIGGPNDRPSPGPDARGTALPHGRGR